MLTPETLGGGRAKTYQLTADSVHPTRIVGRDEYGDVIEETIPINKWREFVTPGGCINKVVLRTGVGVPENDSTAQLIEQHTVTRVISRGFLPVDECPYTNEYRAITGGPLVKPKAGEVDCGGKRGGCEHLHRVMKLRQERALNIWQTEQDKVSKMKAEEVAAQAAAIGKVLVAHQNAGDLRAVRQRAKETRED